MVEALAAQFAAMAKEFKATQRQVAALKANLEAEVAQQARLPGALGASASESSLPLAPRGFGFRIQFTPQLGQVEARCGSIHNWRNLQSQGPPSYRVSPYSCI